MSLPFAASARTVRGRVVDSRTSEEIVGAAVLVKEDPCRGTVTGLDGSFSFETVPGECTLICSFLGYRQEEIRLGESAGDLLIRLEEEGSTLECAVVTCKGGGRSEAAARGLERKAMNVVNVMSAKAMELSPDITVANVIQRMSGVTVERNSSGEGQYAILRGMDKRYNYTLVNGVKIPSPDNKNRFVPLDIFPSEMLDRLEVTKSLTADMEGDGIGGAVNLVMKDAPSSRQFTVNVSTGYSALYLGRDFQSFSHRAISRMSPYEANGMQEDYAVSQDDFTMDNLRIRKSRPLPDLIAGLSYGDRFFGDRLGLMAAVSFQNTYRGKNSSLYYQPGTTHNGIENRCYSDNQMRAGAHLKADYVLGQSGKLTWYNGFVDMQESEVKDASDEKERTVRMKWNNQYIFNSTLSGEHAFLKDRNLNFKWSAVVSKAFSETPDNVQINMIGSHIATSGAATRRWEHNSDRDLAAYADLDYTIVFSSGASLDLSAGAMFRDKRRSSFFNEYTFDSATGPQDPQTMGEDWDNFDEILIVPKPYGNIGDPLNYDASEQVAAGYVMGKYVRGAWEVTAGLRAEHTDQGYNLRFPRDVDPAGCQRYLDLLPDVHVKYNVHPNANLRLSYARSINRPSFFEIVPYSIVYEDYREKGNPDLKHTVADNLDLRYEFFPRSSEQFMVGLFYKHLDNPIEYGLINEGQDTYYMPMNFGDADNMGVEVDVMKYFSWFGIKANYTFTHSSITTQKKTMEGSEVVSVSQTRPLFGQAAHVANLSLLFKDAASGWEGQIAAGYTGKRLSDVSNWYNDDIWEAGYFQLDASVEKTFKCGICVYAKASNLLDSPLIRYVQNGPQTENISSYERYHGGLLERIERHGQSLIIGIRYNL